MILAAAALLHLVIDGSAAGEGRPQLLRQMAAVLLEVEVDRELGRDGFFFKVARLGLVEAASNDLEFEGMEQVRVLGVVGVDEVLESQKQKFGGRLPALNHLPDSQLGLLEDQIELSERSHLGSAPLVRQADYLLHCDLVLENCQFARKMHSELDRFVVA